MRGRAGGLPGVEGSMASIQQARATMQLKFGLGAAHNRSSASGARPGLQPHASMALAADRRCTRAHQLGMVMRHCAQPPNLK